MIEHSNSPQQRLEDVFQTFNQLSAQLTGSYQQLQDRVDQLSRELAASRSDRMQQLVEKERLAERLSKLLQELPAGVVVLDQDRHIVELNPAARALLDDPRPGENWDRVFSRSFHPDYSGEELETRDGRIISLSECRLDQTNGFILLLLDVTETRHYQEALNRQERLSAMGRMAAQLAHQIRTPLSSALLYTGHLARADLTVEQRQRFATRLRSRLQHIERQINDILAFARGDNGVVTAPVSISELAQELQVSLESQLHAYDAELEIVDRTNTVELVEGNRDALLGAFSNLLNNALEHSGRRVRVSITINKPADDVLEISFADNGPGVSPEHRTKVFDPFFTTRADGTGLGLAVVQSVVMSHGGVIRLESSTSGGARFVIRFPLPPEQSLQTQQGKVQLWPKVNSVAATNYSSALLRSHS